MHFKQRIRTTKYPVQRATDLVYVISEDLEAVLLRLLSKHGLMYLEFSEFDKVIRDCEQCFTKWDEEGNAFHEILRNRVRVMGRRDGQRNFGRRQQPKHTNLKERLMTVHKFRKQHDQLKTVIARVLRPSARDQADGMMDQDDQHAIEEVNAAFTEVQDVNPLNLEDDGYVQWDNAQRKYNDRINNVEQRIISKLRDQLGTAQSANEMFRIFARFNALFVRPSIKGAIREYQQTLITSVQVDIQRLQEKFKKQYEKSMSALLSDVRDLPPVSGEIIWARQIDRQLSEYLKRVEDVLGKGWKEQRGGKELYNDGESFRKKLDTQVLFEQWSTSVQKLRPGPSGRVFDIQLQRGQDTSLVLSVNFHPSIITISKEVRNLKALGFRVPLVIVNKSLQANHLYPFAISLKASVKTYSQTLDKLNENPIIVPLVAKYHSAVQKKIEVGVTMRWESYKLEEMTRQLAEAVFELQDKVDDAMSYYDDLDKLVKKLETCPLQRDTLSELLDKIQKLVDDLNLRSYSNLETWVERLDRTVKEKLTSRLSTALRLWLVVLVDYGKEKDSSYDPRTSGIIDFEVNVEDLPVIEKTAHDLTVRNETMQLNPPVERARENLYGQLQEFIAVVTDLPRIQASKYVLGGGSEMQKSKLTYRSILSELPNGCIDAINVYQQIDKVMLETNEYVQSWLQIQSLWDLHTDQVVESLGENLDSWAALLREIKSERRKYNASGSAAEFGPVVIDFSQVQNKVTLKYDQLHKEILTRFGRKLYKGMSSFKDEIDHERGNLETQNIESQTTQEAVVFITKLQELKRKVNKWSTDVENFVGGEKVLRQQRYPFEKQQPPWLEATNVEGAWVTFRDILGRKDSQVQAGMGQLQSKILAEENSMKRSITDVLRDWKLKKPSDAAGDADEAMGVLEVFQGRFSTLSAQFEALSQAKVALELPPSGENQIKPCVEELEELKVSWSALSQIFNAISELKQQTWKTVEPKVVKKALDDLTKQMADMPARVKSYESYNATLEKLKEYKRVGNKYIETLKSDTIQDRHWTLLKKAVGGNLDLIGMTLGSLWDADLEAHSKEVDNVIATAQKEGALRKFLDEVRDEWSTYDLELVNFRDKTKLIRGWVELFDAAKEKLASLGAMKASPYYKVFEEEARGWEEKLNRVFSIFDIWMKVQQRWVYLDGIFGGKEIRSILPAESSRFDKISLEFKGMMKKVNANPAVLEVINIPNALLSLEKLDEVLTKIQKALGDFLEKQRARFPRFYFVGDEDLLEIIGNSKDVEKLQKHFRKLFSGVHSITLDDNSEQIVAVSAKEGETVTLTSAVPVKDRKIFEWLNDLEREINVSLATLLNKAVSGIKDLKVNWDQEKFITWLDTYQAQLACLSIQIVWCEAVDEALAGGGGGLKDVAAYVDRTLTCMADTVLRFQPPILRVKLEQNITEMIHQQIVTRDLMRMKVSSEKDFRWQSQMRFTYNPNEKDVLKQCEVKTANAEFYYGFEYLGLKDKLVQTPLTDRAYMTLTQALMARQGGAPFGPAGTGKTESVKMLGNQLGRFTLVFNCDETFDSQAMQRILIGLSQVGAFGCFDEFNRLEEAQLSAVSQQIETIQLGLLKFAHTNDVKIEIIEGNSIPLNENVGLFITMNPGYAGRSELPDNLKRLFRNLAMTTPDSNLIAQTLFSSQGFREAETLSRKIVPLFQLCKEQLSSQSHYDFGLRALKQVLTSAGNIKRAQLAAARQKLTDAGESIDDNKLAAAVDEQAVVIESVSNTMIPKLVADDIPLLDSLMQDVFPGIEYNASPDEGLLAKLHEVCAEQCLATDESFFKKVLQLYSVTNISHGLMMVGPSGTGKTTAWRVLLEALRRFEGKDAFSYVIDPKAFSKDELYGCLDPTTREWTDGVFTAILRKIINNELNELDYRQWLVLDGDVDPEWVENLNSVLDDNKLLTLPNGERLGIPPNVRIMFEVQDLKQATQATVSRCGMVWFSEDVVTKEMLSTHHLDHIQKYPLSKTDGSVEAWMSLQKIVIDVVRPYFDSIIPKVLDLVETLEHVMFYSHARVLNSLFAMVKNIVRQVHTYNVDHDGFELADDKVRVFAAKLFVYSMMWCFGGDTQLRYRQTLSKFIVQQVQDMPGVDLRPEMHDGLIIDFQVTLDDSSQGEWRAWDVEEVEIDNFGSTNVVIPTTDTERHRDLLYNWLNDHLPVILCGPPGSGKTMTLFNALRALPEFVVVGLNFSSATSPELIMDTFNQHCEYQTTPSGIVLHPKQLNKWLVVFCDEMNLPAADKYETVQVITFTRQLIEHGGFWRPEDNKFVKLERIQFVGACNPPTDPGRVPLSPRFLRHAPVIYVDYPSAQSYTQIYLAFNKAIMKGHHQSLENYARPLTEAMVDFFMQTQERFTADMQPFYIYSPREMTRWTKGVKEAIWPLHDGELDADGLCKVWAHEAMRLFHDRLVFDDEREWTEMKIDEVAERHFAPMGVNVKVALQRPILFSNWMSGDKGTGHGDAYVPVGMTELKAEVEARLKTFHEEELDVPLVLFDEVLDHVLRLDRIFQQNQGHALLIGVSGSGKTTLSRFVAWRNNISVFIVKAHANYTAELFDEDLRTVLLRSGTKGEKICFIMDEGNVMDTAFLERINTLLANGEVPGLFEGDAYSQLMTACKDATQKLGVVADGNDELYRWFSEEVMSNLHVVFTMNPAEGGMSERAATSPALFNRCVLDWFGDWSKNALFQVATEFTAKMDTDKEKYAAPQSFPKLDGVTKCPDSPGHRDAINHAFVYVHESVKTATKVMVKRDGISTKVTPRHFLESVEQFKKIAFEKTTQLEEQKQHLERGLTKLQETFKEVAGMQAELEQKNRKLEVKSKEAQEQMTTIIAATQEAEKNKAITERIAAEVAEKGKAAEEAKKGVDEELAGVKPLVEKAASAVGALDAKKLKELTAYRNPPDTVKLVLEASLVLTGAKKTVIADWRTMKAEITKPEFLKELEIKGAILKDTPEKFPSSIRASLKTYLGKPGFNEEKATHASVVCGTLFVFIEACVKYCEVLEKIKPLTDKQAEMATLVETATKQKDEAEAKVAELETQIEVLKTEYETTIAAKDQIKRDLDRTVTMCARAEKLLGSLGGEKTRWEAGLSIFDEQMETILGDSFLSAAYLAYSGYFNQQYRHALLQEWKNHLDAADIKWDKRISISKFLSDPDQLQTWKTCKLPSDDICTENAIMLTRYIRYPLIIDPANQGVEFIVNYYGKILTGSKKLIVTSFHDPTFRKTLENALRFAAPLLIKDAERYDPLLNPVLNREFVKKAGRNMVQIGNQDIDLSDDPTILLTATDPNIQFSPDLCSRVTMVNFTVTRSSLHSQCLNQVLRSERPDVDAKRNKLLALQGECQAKLHRLEKDLLEALSRAEGSLLDDDKITGQLETLKQNAAEVQEEQDKAVETMTEVETVSDVYTPVAAHCSAIYFTMEQLSGISMLYQYTLQFFLDIFESVLDAEKNTKLKGTEGNFKERLTIIDTELFTSVYCAVAPGMLSSDRMCFAMTLALLRIHGSELDVAHHEVTEFLRGGSLYGGEKGSFASLVDDELMSEGGGAQAHKLSGILDAFKPLLSNITSQREKVKAWTNDAKAEENMPELTEPAKSDTEKMIRELLLLQIFRPDRVEPKSKLFVAKCLGDSFLATAEAAEFTDFVETTDPKTPFLLGGVTGYDPSANVMKYASSKGMSVQPIAIGSAQGFVQAKSAIDNGQRTGKWVILTNVHLAPKWLEKLAKELEGSSPHAKFRLFLTSDISPKLPNSLIRNARVFVFEPPQGIQASLLRTLRSFPDDAMNKQPKERSKLYFLLAWLHAVIQERLRYCPLGWSKPYEFGEPDLRASEWTIASWMDAGPQVGSVKPENIPFEALQTLLAQAIYGGRIGNMVDARMLQSFVNSVITEKAFTSNDFALVKAVGGDKSIGVPYHSNKQQFMEWVGQLTSVQLPSWIGLPNMAERVLLANRARDLVNKMNLLQTVGGDEKFESFAPGSEASSGTAGWMKDLSETANEWLKMLPESLNAMQRDADSIKNPLFRFHDRESKIMSSLLKQVRSDLDAVGKVCTGELKQTNYLRSLIEVLIKGTVPKDWGKYKVPNSLAVNAWVIDFIERIKQAEMIIAWVNAGKDLRKVHLSLSYLLVPEAYFTATRQAVAQANKWSLEQLSMELDVLHKDRPLTDSEFMCTKVRFEGALADGTTLNLIDETTKVAALSVIRWINTADGKQAEKNSVNIPIYLNATRENLLTTVPFTPGGGRDENEFYQLGVAICCSALS